MPQASLQRTPVSPKVLTIAADASVSDVLDISAAAGGHIQVPAAAGWTAADITFEAAWDSNVYHPSFGQNPVPPAFAPVYTEGSSPVLERITLPSGGGWCPIPPPVMALRFIRLKSTAVAGTDAVAQAAARSLYVVLKS